MHKEYYCNYTTSEDDSFFKDICTNGSNASLVECIKDIDNVSVTLGNVLGVWYIIICIVGIFGNLATIICINRYGIALQ